jgi:hypothetical protein
MARMIPPRELPASLSAPSSLYGLDPDRVTAISRWSSEATSPDDGGTRGSTTPTGSQRSVAATPLGSLRSAATLSGGGASLTPG